MTYPLSSSQLSSSLRIGDAERDATCALLAEHYAAGRISEDEMSLRTSAALNSQTAADLNLLLADLPASLARTPQLPPPEPAYHGLPGWMLAIGEVLLGMLGGLAALCLVGLVVMSPHFIGSYGATFLMLGAVAGATSTAALAYFIARYGRRPSPAR